MGLRNKKVKLVITLAAVCATSMLTHLLNVAYDQHIFLPESLATQYIADTSQVDEMYVRAQEYKIQRAEQDAQAIEAWYEYTREHPIPEAFMVSEEEINTETEDSEVSDDSDEPSESLDGDEDSYDYDYDEYQVISYSEHDLFMFEAAMYCECGAQGTSYPVQVANAWIARNKIEQEMAQGSSDPFRDALNPNHYQGVYDDPYNGWRAISPEEGVITQELIDSNPSIHELSLGVLSGEIPSPIYDWDCCICTKTYNFDEVVDIANSLGLSNYFVIENGIFFPSSEWTEEVTQFLMDF